MSAESGASRPTPAWDHPLPDPAVLRTTEGWIAYGTGMRTDSGAIPAAISEDLVHWEGIGEVLRPLPEELGDSYWAPEVCERDGSWWMYFSVGHGDRGHHLRVARAERPEGPFQDLGVNLTPSETFAIDASPFRDEDGSWWLYFARDVLDTDRVGTHLAVAPLPAPDRLGETTPVLAPYADWQIFQRDREMYGQTYTWHTLEGPHLLVRDGLLCMSFSAGNWTGAGYRTAWAHATTPTGPWTLPTEGEDVLLASDAQWIGPGHNSFTIGPDGEDVIVFHAWDEERTGRYMHLRPLQVATDPPRLQVSMGQ